MTIAEQYFSLRTKKAVIESELDAVKEELNKVESEFIMWLENNDLQSIKHDRYGTAFLREEVYARVTDEEKAFTWLRNNNMDALIKPTVHSKSLSAAMKEWMSTGAVAPEGIDAFVKTKIGVRRSS